MIVLFTGPGRWSRLTRGLFFGSLALLTVAVISERTFAMLQLNGWNPMKMAVFGLFVVLLLPIALSFWTAVIGFVVQWRGVDSLNLAHSLKQAPPAEPALPRTAVVIPVYNEDPVRVFAGLKATFESLGETGLREQFDFYVLSDTTHPDVWIQEEMAFDELRKSVDEPERLFYRNRRENVDRKTGNIADFCTTRGGGYVYMIVFDADSTMTGTCLVDLVRLMERHPRVGIIQAPPLPVNSRSLFGRLHQFATHAYSGIFVAGLNFWQGGSANYWGHNAIIRIRPFVEHCRLPKLSGKPPLGGSILSHDFIEAAFMRRAGWKVYLASGLRGSYEEMPSSLVGYATRDRRWCQGNLQHARLLLTPGLHLVSRIHLWMGIMAYVAAPLWLLILALTTIEGIYESLGPHHYFSSGQSLFPVWRLSVERQAVALFIVTMGLLLLPKLLSLLLYLRDRERIALFGGRLRLSMSVLYETLVATLLAPNLAFLQTRFVIGTLMGRNVTWDAQDRGEADTTFRKAIRFHWLGTLIGIVWTTVLALTAPRLVWWFFPVIAGFLLSIPLSAWSSQTRAGERAKRNGLFLIPEEISPPCILQRFHHELGQGANSRWAKAQNGLARVLDDPELFEMHLALLPEARGANDPLRQHYLEGLTLKVRFGGPQDLTLQERRELLLEANCLRALRANLVGSCQPSQV